MKQMSEKTRKIKGKGDEDINDMKEELRLLKGGNRETLERLKEFDKKWQLNEEEAMRKVTTNVLNTRGKGR